MMKLALVSVAVLSALCITSATARADDLDLFAVGVLAEGADVIGFGLGDTLGRDHSVAYGIAETTLNAPVAIGLTYYAIKSTSNDRWLDAGLAIVNGALAAHGIYTIVHGGRDDRSDKPSAMIKVGSVRANLVPSAVSDGSRMGAGLGLGGSF